jgi:colanic acid/amylovoran biosynthesis protein
MMQRKKFLIGPAVIDCNRGDQALLWQAVDIVRQAYPDCEVAVMADINDDPEDVQTCQTRMLGFPVIPILLPGPRRSATPGKQEIIDSGWSLLKIKVRATLDFVQTLILLMLPRSRTLARLLLGKNRYRTYEYLRDCNALVIKGGGYIYAHRGLRGAYFIWFGLFPLMLAQGCGIKVIILPNSFGPFDTTWGRWLARKVLIRCKIVTAREPISFEVLNSLMPGKAKLFPDMAFNLETVDSNWAKEEIIRHGIPLGKKPCVGITMRPWRFPDAKNPRERYHNYVQSFCKLIEYLLNRGYATVLFAHVIGPHAHEDDRIALHDVLHAVPEADRVFYVDGVYNCRQVKTLYGFMDFMVCTRFHSAIFSIAQEIPCLAVSYQGYKATGIMSQIGLEDFVCSINEVDGDTLISIFERLVNEQQAVKQKIREYTGICRKRLQALRELIVSEIDSTPS